MSHESKPDNVPPHRAGWDALFSAPKLISLTALVDGNDRIREAHRQTVCSVLSELAAFKLKKGAL